VADGGPPTDRKCHVSELLADTSVLGVGTLLLQFLDHDDDRWISLEPHLEPIYVQILLDP